MWRTVFNIFCIVVALSLMTTNCYSFIEDIIVAWTLDEGEGKFVTDASGNVDDGEIFGGAEWVDGKFGKALQFDGSTGYVEIPYHDNMEVISEGKFTLVSWFKTDAVDIQRNVLTQKDMNATGRVWLYLTADTNVELASYIGGARTSSGIHAEAGKWYHVAVVVNGTNIQIYVDGKPEGDPLDATYEPSQGAFRISAHKQDNIQNVWSGIIDEVAIFGKALSQAEIQQVMTVGIANALAPVELMGKLTTSWGGIKE